MASTFVLSDDLHRAMAGAEYDKLEDGSFVGRIPACPGVIAFDSTLRGCEEELRSTQYDAGTVVEELFHVGYWLAHTYARSARPVPDLAFVPGKLPKASPAPKQTLEQLQAMQAQLQQQGEPLDQERDREFEVAGMPNEQGRGFVDYVLWGDDGKPLGLVEAKRTRRDPRVGQQQAKLYADCLEQQFGQRPVIFYSNGYEHWLWDDAMYPPGGVQGFYARSELELMIQRRSTRKPLGSGEVRPEIVERYYQTRAVRRVAEAFEHDNERKALLVMATGAGKTRTVIALCDLLTRCNWAKRVLFLALEEVRRRAVA